MANTQHSTLSGSDLHNPKAHRAAHQNGGADSIRIDDLAEGNDNTDLNSSASRHGLLRKLTGVTSDFLRADGTWAAPSGGGGSSTWVALTDTPGDITANRIVRGNASGTAIEQVAQNTFLLDNFGTPEDNTDLNASIAYHGLLPKLGGGTTDFLRADGTWAEPPGGGGADYTIDGGDASSNYTGTAVLDCGGA